MRLPPYVYMNINKGNKQKNTFHPNTLDELKNAKQQ